MKRLGGVYKQWDEKLEKLAKKEIKIESRILWAVVMRMMDGNLGDETVHVGSLNG
jgi:hypothetical protein